QHSRSRAAFRENPCTLGASRSHHRDHRRAVRAPAHRSDPRPAAVRRDHPAYPTAPARRTRGHRKARSMLKGRASLLVGQVFVFAAFFGLWELAVRLLNARPVILPAPSLVFAKIWEQRDMLLANTWPTTVAIALGFVAAVLSGFVLAVGISYSRAVRELTYPFLVAAQVLPKVAFAPLFLIWFGFGITPKIVIAALIAFFPIVINTAKGLGSVEAELLQYLDSLGAKASEKFLKIS